MSLHEKGNPVLRGPGMKTLRWGVVGAALGVSLVGLVGGSRDAQAAGFASQRIGGEQGGVIATNPTALYFNPGAMGFTGGGGLGAYTTLAFRKVTYDRPGANTDKTVGDEGIGNTGRASLFNVFGGPALGGMARIGNLVLGFGFFAPFYGVSHWDKNNSLSAADKATYPLAVDGVQRWLGGGIDGQLNVYYFTWGAAYRFGPLSIGASGNAIYSKLVSTSATNASGNAQADTTLEWRSTIDVDGIYGSFGVGAMLEAVPDQVYIGAGYQSQPGMGEMTMNGKLNLNGFSMGNNTINVDLKESLPDVLRGGVRWHLKDAPWELRLMGDWTRWSEFTHMCIVNAGKPCVINADGSSPTKGQPVAQNLRRNWDDTYGVHLGASYWPRYDVELFAGAWFETAAVPDATMSPDFTDAVSLTGGLGARFRVSSGLFLALSYNHQQFLDRNNIAKSQLAFNNGANVKIPTQEPDGGGIYKQWIGYAQFNAEALFP
jgi:long-chain fatty acid transport protein